MLGPGGGNIMTDLVNTCGSVGHHPFSSLQRKGQINRSVILLAKKKGKIEAEWTIDCSHSLQMSTSRDLVGLSLDFSTILELHTLIERQHPNTSLPQEIKSLISTDGY